MKWKVYKHRVEIDANQKIYTLHISSVQLFIYDNILNVRTFKYVMY